MKSRSREVDSRQIASVEAWADPCPNPVRRGESIAEIPPNPECKSPWKLNLGLPDLRLDAFHLTLEVRRLFNPHRPRPGSVQRILSAMLRHGFH